jgi:glycerol-3-phosphate dehydrogenase (NAD(P)+)
MSDSAAVAVVGAGSWGTALALHVARLGRRVRLWARDPDLARDIERTSENRRYLPGISLPGVEVSASGERVLSGAAVVVVAVPSHGVEGVLALLGPLIPPSAAIVSATKGLDPRDGWPISRLLEQKAPDHPIAVLSGPSFAREVAMDQPTALVVAASDVNLAHRLQRELSAKAFRLYTNRDVLGVELGGALKNVMALATGLCDGLGLGENARAALITRGLAEMVRLGVALGAQPATFAGLAGLGDLVLTCTGTLSRNRALGREIARGRSLAEAEGATPMVAEGVRTTASALRLAHGVAIPMPICEEVGAVLFSGKPVRVALGDLLARDPRAEEEADVLA